MLDALISIVIYMSFVAIAPFWLSYAIGMAEYSRMNIVRRILESEHEVEMREKNMIIRHLFAEIDELIEAVVRFKLIDIVLESCDVLQLVIKYGIAVFSIELLKNELVWMCVFPMILPASIKLGYRYLTQTCIRNHANPMNRNHICRYVE